jgi:hypothetical protein
VRIGNWGNPDRHSNHDRCNGRVPET